MKRGENRRGGMGLPAWLTIWSSQSTLLANAFFFANAPQICRTFPTTTTVSQERGTSLCWSIGQGVKRSWRARLGAGQKRVRAPAAAAAGCEKSSAVCLPRPAWRHRLCSFFSRLGLTNPCARYESVRTSTDGPRPPPARGSWAQIKRRRRGGRAGTPAPPAPVPAPGLAPAPSPRS